MLGRRKYRNSYYRRTTRRGQAPAASGPRRTLKLCYAALLLLHRMGLIGTARAPGCTCYAKCGGGDCWVCSLDASRLPSEGASRPLKVTSLIFTHGGTGAIQQEPAAFNSAYSFYSFAGFFFGLERLARTTPSLLTHDSLQRSVQTTTASSRHKLRHLCPNSERSLCLRAWRPVSGILSNVPWR